MADYKPTTQSVLQKAKEIRNFLDSQQYKDFTNANDISSQNSSFRNGDQTFSDALELLDIVINSLLSNSLTLDKIEPGQRSNFQNYLDNIFSWLTSNLEGNWSSILQYSSTMYQWIHQWGLTSNELLDERTLNNYKKIKINNEEIANVQKLSSELKSIKEASDKLDAANEIISFVEKTSKVEELSKYVETAETEIDELTSKARELLAISSDAKIYQTFVNISDQYKLEVYGNLHIPRKYFLWSLYGLLSTISLFFLIKFLLTDKNASYIYSLDTIQWLSILLSTATLVILLRFNKSRNVEPKDKFEESALKIKLGWVHYFLLSVIVILPTTIFLAYRFAPKVDYQNEFLEVITNGLIRIAWLAPAMLLVAFVSRNFLRKDKRRESYEFKSVAVKTIEGHILSLKNYAPDVLPEIVGKAISQIYDEPRDNFSEKDNMNLEVVNELLSMAEKIKSIGK